jgi:hypothetical protein
MDYMIEQVTALTETTADQPSIQQEFIQFCSSQGDALFDPELIDDDMVEFLQTKGVTVQFIQGYNTSGVPRTFRDFLNYVLRGEETEEEE